MLQIDKKELRERLTGLRDRIPEEVRSSAGAEIFRRVRALEQYAGSETVLCYVSVGSEPATREFITAALREGKKVAVPVISRGEMTFGYIDSVNSLVPGAYGIPTAPRRGGTVSDFSSCICITPCVSVDETGVRLGNGGGYYDRFLGSHREVFSVAVCFDETLSRELPREDHDIIVDMYITQTVCKEVS